MRRDLATIVQLGAAFALIFSAFNSQGLIEISVLRNLAKDKPSSGITENSGYYSLSIIYLVFTVSNLGVPPLIRRLGNKWSQVIGAVCYLGFMLTFLHLNALLLYMGSALLGFGAALLWTANGAYIVQFSRDGKLSRNTGILWAMLQTSFISGGLFLGFIINNGDLVSSYRLVYLVFSIVVAIGVCVLAALPSQPLISSNTPTPDQDSDGDDIEADPLLDDDMVASLPTTTALTFREEIMTLLRTMRSTTMQLLTAAFFFSGLETTFYTGVYTTCVQSTLALSKPHPSIIAFIAFAIGSGQIAGGLLFGTIGKRLQLNKTKIIVGVLFVHLLAFLACFLVLPAVSPVSQTSETGYIETGPVLIVLIGFLLGFADSGWQTQIYNALGEYYPSNAADAFAIFKFVQSLACAISFLYSSVAGLPIQLTILAIFSIIGAGLFVHCESRNQQITAPA